MNWRFHSEAWRDGGMFPLVWLRVFRRPGLSAIIGYLAQYYEVWLRTASEYRPGAVKVSIMSVVICPVPARFDCISM